MASAIRLPATLTSSVSDRSFCLRSLPPWRRARVSTTSAPTLWRVLAYSSPGLPRPTTSRSADAPVRGLRRNIRSSSQTGPTPPARRAGLSLPGRRLAVLARRAGRSLAALGRLGFSRRLGLGRLDLLGQFQAPGLADVGHEVTRFLGGHDAGGQLELGHGQVVADGEMRHVGL